jgi:hypothetical protein
MCRLIAGVKSEGFEVSLWNPSEILELELKKSDNLTPSNVPRASGIATTGSISSRLKKGPARDAGSYLDANGRKIGESAGVVFQFNVFDHRWR